MRFNPNFVTNLPPRNVPNKNTKESLAITGTMRALTSNIIKGVDEGFEKKLEINGVGYRATLEGNSINLNLGFSHPIKHDLPEGVSADLPSNTEIILKSMDKQLVGQVAAEIRGEWFPSSLGTSSVISSVQQVMKLTGLDSIASKSVAEIPTGKARLVELARTVVQGPSMLLLDEPASGQNENETEEFAQILKILNTEGITILLVEHDMSLVMDVCDKVFVLDFGTLIADGTTDEIQNNPVVIDAYLGGTNG